MILTCPNCATRFFVADDLIGPEGLRVKCDACGEVWAASQEPGHATFTQSPPAPLVAAEPYVEGEPEVEVADQTEAIASADPVAAPAAEEAPLFVRRPGVPEEPRPSGGRRWGLTLLLIVAGLIVGLLLFQTQLTRAFPGAATIYGDLGLAHADKAGG